MYCSQKKKKQQTNRKKQQIPKSTNQLNKQAPLHPHGQSPNHSIVIIE